MSLEGKTILYIVSFEYFFKIGITSNTVAKRLKNFPEYTVLLEKQVYTGTARKLEKLMLAHIAELGLQYPLAEVPDGHTECFVHEDPQLEQFITYINGYIDKFDMPEAEYEEKFSNKKSYTPKDKEVVQDLITEGVPIKDISLQLGIPTGTLYRWVSERKNCSSLHTWTDKDHELVASLTAQGWTVQAISNETGFSVGSIKRSRSLGRSGNVVDKDARIEYLETQVSDLITQLKEVKEWVDRKKRAEAKERDYAPPTTGFQLKRAGTI